MMIRKFAQLMSAGGSLMEGITNAGMVANRLACLMKIIISVM
jgi:hypothetical protein